MLLQKSEILKVAKLKECSECVGEGGGEGGGEDSGEGGGEDGNEDNGEDGDYCGTLNQIYGFKV